jgi:hypothetical protein
MSMFDTKLDYNCTYMFHGYEELFIRQQLRRL